MINTSDSLTVLPKLINRWQTKMSNTGYYGISFKQKAEFCLLLSMENAPIAMVTIPKDSLQWKEYMKNEWRHQYKVQINIKKDAVVEWRNKRTKARVTEGCFFPRLCTRKDLGAKSSPKTFQKITVNNLATEQRQNNNKIGKHLYKWLLLLYEWRFHRLFTVSLFTQFTHAKVERSERGVEGKGWGLRVKLVKSSALRWRLLLSRFYPRV